MLDRKTLAEVPMCPGISITWGKSGLSTVPAVTALVSVIHVWLESEPWQWVQAAPRLRCLFSGGSGGSWPSRLRGNAAALLAEQKMGWSAEQIQLAGQMGWQTVSGKEDWGRWKAGRQRLGLRRRGFLPFGRCGIKVQCRLGLGQEGTSGGSGGLRRVW